MPDTDLHVIADIVAKPEEADTVREAFLAFAKGAAHEPGCKKYAVLEDTTTPGHFMTQEIWSDQAALDAHMKTPEIAALVGKVQSLLAKPFVIVTLEALT